MDKSKFINDKSRRRTEIKKKIKTLLSKEFDSEKLSSSNDKNYKSNRSIAACEIDEQDVSIRQIFRKNDT